MSRHDLGLGILRDLVGDAFADRLADDTAAQALGWYLNAHTVEHCFAAIWGRESLDRRSRSIATIGMLMGLDAPSALKSQVRIGLRNGLTDREIFEVAVQAIPYLGYPTAETALKIVADAMNDESLIPRRSLPSDEDEKSMGQAHPDMSGQPWS